MDSFGISFFFSSGSRHTIWNCDWSSDVCSSDLAAFEDVGVAGFELQHIDLAVGWLLDRAVSSPDINAVGEAVLAAVQAPGRALGALDARIEAGRSLHPHHASQAESTPVLASPA